MSLRNWNSAVTTSWFRFGRPTYPIGETEKELLPPAEGTPRPLPVAPSQRGEFTAMTPGATAEEQKPSHRLPRRQSPESKVPFLSRFSWACWDLGPLRTWLAAFWPAKFHFNSPSRVPRRAPQYAEPSFSWATTGGGGPEVLRFFLFYI